MFVPSFVHSYNLTHDYDMLIVVISDVQPLINALSAHMIHINLNMIFYTHVEQSPTKTIYIKYYTKQKRR